MAVIHGTPIPVQKVSELVSGQNLFESNGLTRLKVTKDGKPEILEFKIKSTGAADYIDSLMEQAPEPPKRIETIKKGSKEGQALGLKHSEMHVKYDHTDPEYVKELDDHNQKFIWRVAIFALDTKWTKTDGSQAESFDEKVEILKDNGIHGHHIDQIYEDAVALTQHSEDKQDFLSDSS